MAALPEYRRRLFLPLAGLLLAGYYLGIFLPLSHQAESLDEPLQKAWRRLAAAIGRTNTITIDFQQITNQWSETREALALLETTQKQAASRLELAPALRARLTAPFQLVDYQNERSKQIDDLDRAARQQQIQLDPGVLAGFPEHTVDLREPALLWAALALTQDLLQTAVQCKVTAVHSLEVPVALSNSNDADAPSAWAEIPLQLEFTAPAGNALKLIESLPLRAEELHAAGLPQARPEKSPLFIRRLIIKRQAPEKPDEVRVALRLVGFVPQN